MKLPERKALSISLQPLGGLGYCRRASAFLLCSRLCTLPLCPSLGIMAILFSGIVMSHYTHHNLSPVTQILMQQTLRTVAFLCGESCPPQS